MSAPTPVDLKKTVDDCRKLLENDLGDLIEELGSTLSDETKTLAGLSRDHAQRTAYLRLQIDLQSDWVKFAPAFRAALARQNASAAGSARRDVDSTADLAILSDNELTVQLAMRDVAGRLEESCAEESNALERRTAHLMREQVLAAADNPFRIAFICDCLETASAAVFPDAGRRVLLLRQIGNHLSTELPQLFRAINEALIEAGILPSLKRSYRNSAPTSATSTVAAAEAARITSTIERLAKARTPAGVSNLGPAASAPDSPFFKSLQTLKTAPVESTAGTLTNVVRLARDSDAARTVKPMEAVTLDIVSALFDLIFGDESVSEGIKQLVSRLQIPVLKVAMQNPQFFADRGHPARRFLDSLSGVAIRWGKRVDANDPFYIKLSELVEHIQETYDKDLGVFEVAITDLAKFIGEREAVEAEANRALAEAVHAREEEIRAQREAQAKAQEAADKALAPLLAHELPEVVEQFLRTHWRDVLQGRIAALNGDKPEHVGESTHCAEALRLANDLIWSVTPKKDADERKRQTQLLPTLVKGLNAGLDAIGMSADERRSFMDALVELQLAALRAEPPVKRKEGKDGKPLPKPAAAAPAPTLQVSHATDSGVRVQDISLTKAETLDTDSHTDRSYLRRVRQLVRGDWVDFIALGQTRRERLTWINPSRTLLLFSNHAADCAISITPEALALRLKNDSARLVKRDTPIFERALRGAVQSLETAT